MPYWHWREGTIMRLLRRLRHWLRLGADHAELLDELAFHRESLEREFVARGMTIIEARMAARRALGNDTYMREEARQIWLPPRLEAFWQDVGYAWRGLRRSPGFTAAVVLTLTFGIGVNAAVFSLVDRLLFRAPPTLVDPSTVHRLYLYRTYRGVEAERSGQYLRYTDLRRWTTSFSRMAAFAEQALAVGTDGDVRELPLGVVSASFFGFFDAPPALGRYFNDSEDQPPHGTPVVVLSHSLWHARYAGRADVLDSTLEIGQVRYRIIGVAAEQFVGLWPDQPPVAYIPVTTYGGSVAGSDWWSSYSYAIGIGTLARRKPGVTVAAATADLTQALRRSYQVQIATTPGSQPLALTRPRGVVAPVLSARGPEASGLARVATWFGAVALAVLLIAAANVANLLLARALRRRREIAVRISLGVSHARLLAQTLTESLLLALISAATGLAVAQWAGGALRAVLLPGTARASAITDWRTVLFATAAAVIVGVLAGIAPVLHAHRIDLANDLKAGAREGSYQRSPARTALVIAQGALCVALLVGAGLFVQSLRHVRHVHLGYDVDPVLFVSWHLRGQSLDSAHTAALNVRLLEAAQSVPGVAHASLIHDVPFEGESEWPLFVQGIDSVSRLGTFDRNGVSADYFATMGTRIVLGRGVANTDGARSQPVMVVGASMARVLWPGQDPIGKCVRIATATMPCTSVVGVAEDVHTHSMGREIGDYFYYLPASQMSPSYVSLAVRTAGDPAMYITAVRHRLQRELPAGAYVTTERMSDVLGSQTRTWRAGTMVFAALGALALLVAAIGLYGVIAYNVAQRTHELGVRLALGARRSSLVGLVVADGLRFSLAGVAVGCAIAWAAGRWMAPLLFEESPRDPVVFGAVASALLAVAIVASALPAARAARVDPKQALAAE